MASIDKMVKCPRCRQACRYHESNPWRPFCSERCKIIDIAAWASEEFRVPGEAVNPEDVQNPYSKEPSDDQ